MRKRMKWIICKNCKGAGSRAPLRSICQDCGGRGSVRAEDRPPTKAQLWRRVARIVGELALIDGPDEPPFGLIPSGMKSVYDVKGFVSIVRAIDRGAVACAMKRKRERIIAKLEAALAAWEAAE